MFIYAAQIMKNSVYHQNITESKCHDHDVQHMHILWDYSALVSVLVNF